MENTDRTRNQGGREGQGGGGQQQPGGGGQKPGGGGQQQPGGGQKQGGYQTPGQSPDQGERDKTRRAAGELDEEGDLGVGSEEDEESDDEEDGEEQPGTIRNPDEDENGRRQRSNENSEQRQFTPSESNTPKTA